MDSTVARRLGQQSFQIYGSVAHSVLLRINARQVTQRKDISRIYAHPMLKKSLTAFPVAQLNYAQPTQSCNHARRKAGLGDLRQPETATRFRTSPDNSDKDSNRGNVHEPI